MRKFIIYFILLILIISCKYKFRINTDPKDARIFIDGFEISNNEVFTSMKKDISINCIRFGYKEYNKKAEKKLPVGTDRLKIKLEPENYSITIKTLNGSSQVIFNSNNMGNTPVKLQVEYGAYDLILKRKDYPDQTVRLEAKKNGEVTYSHKKQILPIKEVGVFKCGRQPKQVIYSPDDKYIFIPNLDGDGFDIFSCESMSLEKNIAAPDPKKNKGFPEGLFIPEKKIFLISQMTTGYIYQYSYPGLEFERKFKTYGNWSKFMAYSKVQDILAVSNWLTNDVSIINFSDSALIRMIKTGPAPRGLAFTGNGEFLFITSYDGGEVYKYETKNWMPVKSIHKNNSAMRHILLTKDDKTAFVSDMHNNVIYEMDTQNMEVINIYKTDYNPNTISLTPDEKYLFVSCRGPNDRESYLNRSPRSGEITIIDLKGKKVIAEFYGGNQPTGLAISNDGNYLCFSNFRDDNIEIYWIKDIWNE